MKIPLLSDLTHQISKDYGVYLEDQGHALRYSTWLLFILSWWTSACYFISKDTRAVYINIEVAHIFLYKVARLI